MPRKSPGLSFLANSASRTSATICADSDDARPANMMRAVSSPLIDTGCRNAVRGGSWHVRAFVETGSMYFLIKSSKDSIFKGAARI